MSFGLLYLSKLSCLISDCLCNDEELYLLHEGHLCGHRGDGPGVQGDSDVATPVTRMMGLVLAAAPAKGGAAAGAHHVVTPPHLLPEEPALGAASHLDILLELLEVAVHSGELGVLGELGTGGRPMVLLAAPDACPSATDAGYPGHGEVPPPGHPPTPGPALEEARVRGQS